MTPSEGSGTEHDKLRLNGERIVAELTATAKLFADGALEFAELRAELLRIGEEAASQAKALARLTGKGN